MLSTSPLKYHFTLLGFSFCFFGCGQKMVESRSYDLMLKGILEEKVPFISVDSLVKKDTGSYILLDTRSRAEYEVSRIPGGVWVGPDYDPERIPELKGGHEVITYCSVGKRSEDLGAAISRQNDSLHVSNLYGGIFEWVNRGHRVQVQGERTDSVHAYNKSWGIWLKKGEKVYEPKPGQKASR
jgi:rhodanese-related sulfurtransferase